jgi:hypothetical protein
VSVLGPEGIAALEGLDAIEPVFDVWWKGQRQGVEVPQPASAAPGMDKLLIGDLGDVNVSTWKRKRFDAVLILCPEMIKGDYIAQVDELAAQGVVVWVCPAFDTWNFDIVNEVLLPGRHGALEWVSGLLKRQSTVLVVCWGGVNRSGAVVAACMVFHYNWPLVPAVQALMKQRGVVLTNRSFRFLLVKMCLDYGKCLV